MRATRYLATALTLAVALGACEEPTAPLAESASGVDELDAAIAAASTTDGDGAGSRTAATSDGTASRERRGGGSGGHALFQRLAAEIPGFGGLYRAGRCQVVVVLTDLAEAEHAVRVVHAALQPLVARTCQDALVVRAAEGEFTYGELQRFLWNAQPLLRARGVLGLKVDYARNRLVVLVSSREVQARVLEALAELGIPADAVVFQGGSGGDGRG